MSKKGKLRLIAVTVIALAVFCWPGLRPADAAAPASAGDPLVAQSWVDEYAANRFDALSAQIAALKAQLAKLKAAQKVDITLTISQPTAMVNGVSTPIDAANRRIVPYIDGNGRTMVPVRFIAEALGAQVTWDGQARTVRIEDGATRIVMTVDSTRYTINGAAKTMDTAPIIHQGWDRTMVPVRFVGEALGCALDWAPHNDTVQFVYITR